MQNSWLTLYFKVNKDANEWIYTSPCAHAAMKSKYMGPKGMDTPVTHDVSGHRALKKQQNSDIGVSLDI